MDKYPEITFAVQNKFKQLIRDKLTPWMFLNATKQVSISDFYGHTIHYSGVEFEGSPREVFWGGFIEPFIENIFVWAYEFALDHTRKRNIEGREAILYTRECLLNGVNSSYRTMQKIDRNLRGKGYPGKVVPRDTLHEIDKMQIKLDEYRDSALTSLECKNKQSARLSDAVELKPGIWGISFDLKKFWKWLVSKFKYSKKPLKNY